MKKITFIVPTKNRTIQLEKFIKYHKKIFKNLKYKFLIVDGSNTINHIKVKKFCKKNKISLLKQKKSGFMNSCFESINKVKTEYCTFLYDDDQLSPEIYKVFKNTLNKNFSMGYGILEDLNLIGNFSEKKFNKIKFFKYNNSQILLAYFGYNNLEIPFMPVSPICFIFKSSFLNNWKKYLIAFCKSSGFRKNILLKKNIGPDLIIYLLQILQNKTISLSKPHIAIFNSHQNSMSTLLGANKLQIGYWLAKKSIFEMNLINKKIIFKTYNFLYISGVYILLKNLLLKIFGKDNFYNEICYELNELKSHKNAEFSLFECIIIIFNKIKVRLKYYG